MQSKPLVEYLQTQVLANNKLAPDSVVYVSIPMNLIPVAAFCYIILKGNLKLLDAALCLHTVPHWQTKHIREVNANI